MNGRTNWPARGWHRLKRRVGKTQARAAQTLRRATVWLPEHMQKVSRSARGGRQANGLVKRGRDSFRAVRWPYTPAGGLRTH